MKINKNFLDLEANYLFSTVGKKQREYQAAHPEADVIKLSIGDVTKPLCPAVIEAMHKAVDEMADEKSFRGYPPETGYDFIIEKILKYDFTDRGIKMDKSEIFLSDGAKSDCGNIGDIFAVDNKVAICDPVYPVYLDTNIMFGRKNNVIIMPCTEENGFSPKVPAEGDEVPDIIYLCFPNNPTGSVATRQQLKEWVDYANKHHSVILFDAAYECFITDEELPRSIFEIEGAKSCAIEFCSFSKMAGFTGTRCGWTVVPKELENGLLNKMWLRRQTTKFNGVPYIVQRGAEAVFSEVGQKEIQENLNYYKENAKIISDVLKKHNIWHIGGQHSPYIWLKCPNNLKSWEFFDYLLENIQVVGTPGSGFGRNGEGYFRLTSFGSRENTQEAVERMDKLFK